MDIRGSDVPWEGQVQGDSGSGPTDADGDTQGGQPVPWKPRTRQEEGRKTEAKTAKREGIRLHPNSGAGRIKFDGSDDERVVEVKDAIKSFTLSHTYLLDLFKTAARQGKDAVLIVEFPDLTATIIINRK